MLQTFALAGCDYLPGFFNISHSLALRTWEEMSKTHYFNLQHDFLELILKVYQSKNHRLEDEFSDDMSESVTKRIYQTREVLKLARAAEHLVIPLPSVLKLQVQRSEYVRKMWTNTLETLEDRDPEKHGWKR